MKKIAILGSTGSIGTQTLDVIRAHPGDFQVTALSAGRNVALLAEQIREFRPTVVSVERGEDRALLRERIGDCDVEIHAGMEGLVAVAAESDASLLVTAIVGMVGIRPAIAAIRAGKDIALANKETLVCAGHLIMPLARERDVRILPVDSEHSAILQALHGDAACGNAIDRIVLTASGGPFLGRSREELARVTLADALRHPTWNMGKKVTIDSATLVNKGLEVIEAKWLFDVAPEQIRVVLHPQSIVHSMVQFEDGALLAQLAVPDMRLPIQYALYYPERKPLAGERLDFAALHSLTFEEPDFDTFPGPSLAYQALARGGNIPTVLNAANEAAVALFLDGKIPFFAITELIAEAMDVWEYAADPDVEEIFATEEAVQAWIERKRTGKGEWL